MSNEIKKRGNPIFFDPKTNPLADGMAGTGGNTRNIGLVLKCNEIAQTVDRHDPQSVWNGFLQYAAVCAEMDCRLSTQCAILALGMSTRSYMYYCAGQFCSKEMHEVMKRIKQVLSAQREMMMMDEKHPLHPAVGIWWQKNYDGMSDNPQLLSEPDHAETVEDAQSIKDKYSDLTE